MKVALCFIISYSQSLNKEKRWKEWIEPNKDIINVYFHYKNYNTIPSKWVRDHALPLNAIVPTTYARVVPAYVALLKFATCHSNENEWFIFLTESCVPIIHPSLFRQHFFENHSSTLMNWKPAYWNIEVCNRANLKRLQKEFHLANDAWFVLNRKHAIMCIKYSIMNRDIYDLICSGNIANESIFAIMLYSIGKINEVKKMVEKENKQKEDITKKINKKIT